MRKFSTFCTEALLIDDTVRSLEPNYYLLGNKVLDGGFDFWKDPNTPRFWTPSISGLSTVVRSGTYKKDGNYSVELALPGADQVSVAQSISLFPGWYYTLHLWLRGSAAGKIGKVVLADSGGNVYLQTDGTWLASGSVSVPAGDHAFTEFSLTFRAPNYESYVLTLLGDSDAISSNIYFDSVTIVEASNLRPYFPQPAKEAEIYCEDAAVYYGVGGNIPTQEIGFILIPSEIDPKELKELKNFDEIRTFKAVRNGPESALLMVNYKR